MTIPKITPYSGGVANPDGSQTQTEFTQNMFDQLSYEAQLASELNATVNATNTTASEVTSNSAIAQNSADAAQAAANFEGDFIVGVTSAIKGKSYLYNGNVWLCLQNTTSTPSTVNAAWKLSIGEQYVTEAQEDFLPPGSLLFKGSDGITVKNGDAVPVNTTHLRVLVSGKPTIVAMSPVTSGAVSLLAESGATIGVTLVTFGTSFTANFNGVNEMLSSQTMIGGRYCTGNTDWKKIDDSNGNILDFQPLNALHIDDFGTENINTMFTLGADIDFGHNKVYTFDTLWRGVPDNITIRLNKSTIRRGDSMEGGVFSYSPESQFLLVDGYLSKNVTIEDGFVDMRIHEFDIDMNFSSILNNGGRLEGWKFKNVIGIDVRTICTSYNSASGINDLEMIDCDIESTVPILIAEKVPYAVFAGVQTTNSKLSRCKSLDSSFHLAIFDADPVQSYPCANNIVEECEAKGTYDTSIYFYGDYNYAVRNKIEDPGKDGLKVNSATYHESKLNTLEENTITGAAGLVQNDGGNMIVLAGRDNKAVRNRTIFTKLATAISYTPKCIVTEGANNVVEENYAENISPGDVNLIQVTSFINNISKEDGQTVRKNMLKNPNGGSCIILDGSGVYFAKVNENNLEFKDVGLYMERTLSDPNMLSDDLYMHLKNNDFKCVGDDPDGGYSILTTSNVSRVFSSGNIFHGLRQRDLRAGVGFIGVDNHADENMNETFINNWRMRSTGSKFTAVPTYGTYEQGDVVGDGANTFTCLSSGTQGTLAGGVTASTTTGSRTVTVSSSSALQYGKYISISGESGKFCISKVVDGTTIEVNRAPANTASGLAVDFFNATWRNDNP